MRTRCQDSVIVCGITNMSFVGLHTLQKVKIQFLVAPMMKHIHADTRARAHIPMQRYTLNVTDEKLSTHK